jgi:predicted DNA-binding transcriptional regulator AlpA
MVLNEKQLLSAKDVAAMTGYHVSTVHRLRKSGKIPQSVTEPPQKPRWNVDEVKEWMRLKKV